MKSRISCSLLCTDESLATSTSASFSMPMNTFMSTKCTQTTNPKKKIGPRIRLESVKALKWKLPRVKDITLPRVDGKDE